MKRFLTGIILLSLTAVISWAETTLPDGDPEPPGGKVDLLQDNIEQHKDSIHLSRQNVFLKVYSMNSMLFIETDDNELISVFTKGGDLAKEISATGTLTALPITRGTYTVKVGNVSRQVVVK